MKTIQNNTEYISRQEAQFFTASVIHDLKTPISAQMKILELLLDGNFGRLSEKQKAIISEVRHSCQYTYNLTLNIMDFFLYEQNQITLRKENFVWNDFISELSCEFSALLKEKSQLLSVKSDSSDKTFYLDKLQMKRVIMNLLSNASLYSPNNSVIEIYSGIKNDALKFRISNQSSFPVKEKISKNFDIFRTKTDNLHYKNSSRIGLYVVKKIIEAHKGKVYAKITKDNLCIIRFTIPKENKDYILRFGERPIPSTS